MKAVEKDCPVGKVVELLGDNCSILIVRDLLDGPRRFNELEKSLKSSSRTLAKKLKLLEREKMIARKEVVGEPACIRYQLTRKGEAFQEVVDAMRSYGKKYL